MSGGRVGELTRGHPSFRSRICECVGWHHHRQWLLWWDCLILRLLWWPTVNDGVWYALLSSPLKRYRPTRAPVIKTELLIRETLCGNPITYPRKFTDAKWFRMRQGSIVQEQKAWHSVVASQNTKLHERLFHKNKYGVAVAEILPQQSNIQGWRHCKRQQ